MLSEIPAPFCLKHLIQPCKGNARDGGKGGYEPLCFFFSFAQKLAFLLLDRPTGQKSPGNRTENIVKSHYLKFTGLLTSGLGRTLCQPSDQYNNKQISPLKVTFPPRFLHSFKRELKATFNHHDISSITDCHRTWLLGR